MPTSSSLPLSRAAAPFIPLRTLVSSQRTSVVFQITVGEVREYIPELLEAFGSCHCHCSEDCTAVKDISAQQCEWLHYTTFTSSTCNRSETGCISTMDCKQRPSAESQFFANDAFKLCAKCVVSPLPSSVGECPYVVPRGESKEGDNITSQATLAHSSPIDAMIAECRIMETAILKELDAQDSYTNHILDSCSIDTVGSRSCHKLSCVASQLYRAFTCGKYHALHTPVPLGVCTVSIPSKHLYFSDENMTDDTAQDDNDNKINDEVKVVTAIIQTYIKGSSLKGLFYKFPKGGIEIDRMFNSDDVAGRRRAIPINHNDGILHSTHSVGRSSPGSYLLPFSRDLLSQVANILCSFHCTGNICSNNNKKSSSVSSSIPNCEVLPPGLTSTPCIFYKDLKMPNVLLDNTGRVFIVDLGSSVEVLNSIDAKGNLRTTYPSCCAASPEGTCPSPSFVLNCIKPNNTAHIRAPEQDSYFSLYSYSNHYGDDSSSVRSDSAPEGVIPIITTTDAVLMDIWSFGALCYEFTTGEIFPGHRQIVHNMSSNMDNMGHHTFSHDKSKRKNEETTEMDLAEFLWDHISKAAAVDGVLQVPGSSIIPSSMDALCDLLSRIFRYTPTDRKKSIMLGNSSNSSNNNIDLLLCEGCRLWGCVLSHPFFKERTLHTSLFTVAKSKVESECTGMDVSACQSDVEAVGSMGKYNISPKWPFLSEAVEDEIDMQTLGM